MSQIKDNIISHTGKHLTYEDRIKSEGYKELDCSNRKIARTLKRAPQIINNAINQGMVRTINQCKIHIDIVFDYDQHTYSADANHQTYLRNHKNFPSSKLSNI